MPILRLNELYLNLKGNNERNGDLEIWVKGKISGFHSNSHYIYTSAYP